MPILYEYIIKIFITRTFATKVANHELNNYSHLYFKQNIAFIFVAQRQKKMRTKNKKTKVAIKICIRFIICSKKQSKTLWIVFITLMHWYIYIYIYNSNLFDFEISYYHNINVFNKLFHGVKFVQNPSIMLDINLQMCSIHILAFHLK